MNHQVVKTLSDSRRSEHERYLDVYRFIQKKDRELGDAFNDFRRSTATRQISIIRSLGVVTEEEVVRFTQRFTSEKAY